MASHFADRLHSQVKDKQTPLVVGLDPVYHRLPKQIKSHRDMNDEYDVAAAIDAIFDYSTQLLRVVADFVPAVKINIAFFEKYLWEGIETFYSLITEANELGLEVIADVKRGDIGHTAEQYAIAHLQNPELTGLEDTIVADAITVNGFAGTDGIEPFAKMAAEQGKGAFVWVRSSNPSATELQDFADANGEKMYQKMADVVSRVAEKPEYIGQSGYSNVGMIVGGTSGEETVALREKYPRCWFLVPGFGSQGATADDCVRYCNADGTGALISSSRSIIYAYEKPQYKEQFGDDWKKCVAKAVTDTKKQIEGAMQRRI